MNVYEICVVSKREDMTQSRPIEGHFDVILHEAKDVDELFTKCKESECFKLPGYVSEFSIIEIGTVTYYDDKDFKTRQRSTLNFETFVKELSVHHAKIQDNIALETKLENTTLKGVPHDNNEI